MTLQGNWDTHALHIWAAPGDAPTSSDLAAIVSAVTGGSALGEPSEVALWLPRNGRLTIENIPTLRLCPADAVELLLNVPPDQAAPSLRFWSAVARMVVQSIAAGQFHPDLQTGDDGRPTATWRLLLGESTIERLERFADAMPPVCRAIASRQPPEAARLVESFITSTTEAIIRRDVSVDPFFQRVHELARLPDASPELRWLSGLLGNDPSLDLDIDAGEFREQVRAWVGRLDEGRGDAPWGLGFVLHEPQAGEDGQEIAPGESVWRVEFRLHPPGDGVAPIDAAALWASRAGTGHALLGRRLAERRERLRSDLSAAAAVFPPLQRIADAPQPAHVDLTASEAHLLIRNWAPLLRQIGLTVELPEWATGRELTPGLLLDVRPAEEMDAAYAAGARRGSDVMGGGFGLDALLAFDWQVAMGDLRMTVEQFQSLAASAGPLAQIGGRWVQLDVEAAHRAALFLEKRQSGTMTLAEAFRTAFATTAAQAGGIPIVGLTGTSWIEQLLQQSPASHLQALSQPEGFQGELRPYQRRGLDWLWFLHRLGIGACLADDMGLGKTIQLIALLLHERHEAAPDRPRQTIGPTLLFAPTSVVGNWVKELVRFAPELKVLVHHGPLRLRGEAFVEAAERHDVVITSYALAHRDHADFRRPLWRRLVLDEAQKIKNPYAAATQAIRSLGAPHRVALTGTPVENHLSELWSIMEMLNPGLLGSAGDFRERFALPIEKLGDAPRADQLRRLIQPFVLRRSKDDPVIAGDLPDKLEMRVYCNLSPEQAALYQRIADEMLGQVDAADGIRRRALVLKALTRLKQACDHPELILKGSPATLSGRSGKCERLIEMLEEAIEEGDRALVFTQFRQMGHLLERLLVERLGGPVLFLHGGTPAAGRDAMIDRFQREGSDVRVFILSLRAGGLGLNLTAANHVFHFDRWWNPAVEAQATDRAHRIGQTRKVQVHKYVCIGTVEERIDQLLSEKVALARKIVGSGDEWLTNLSTIELRKAIELSDAAVAEF
jgi:superfamily II DNA or RNA helicase